MHFPIDRTFAIIILQGNVLSTQVSTHVNAQVSTHVMGGFYGRIPATVHHYE